MIRVNFVATLSLIVTVVYPSGGISDQDDEFTVKLTVTCKTSLNDYLAEVVGRDVLKSSHAESTYSILKKIQPSVSMRSRFCPSSNCRR